MRALPSAPALAEFILAPSRASGQPTLHQEARCVRVSWRPATTVSATSVALKHPSAQDTDPLAAGFLGTALIDRMYSACCCGVEDSFSESKSSTIYQTSATTRVTPKISPRRPGPLALREPSLAPRCLVAIALLHWTDHSILKCRAEPPQIH